MWIYLNGHFVSEEAATLSVFDRGFLYGDGLFETLRAYSGKIFRLDQHLMRLSRSAQQIFLPLPSPFEMAPLLAETLDRNALKNALLRVTLTRGRGEAGLDLPDAPTPTLMIMARVHTISPDRYPEGVSTVILPRTRGGRPELKSISFLENVLGKREARLQGAFEGLFMNPDGHLTEGTFSNLFWTRRGVLYTPSLETGILEGITRGVVLELAQRLNLPIQEGAYKADALLMSDEAFLTSTGMEILPITQVNHQAIGPGTPGPLTQKLHQAFLETVQKELTSPALRVESPR